ncbi:MAG: thiamine diphosphokinase [Clostridia bacterium]|nr:thiamine diphosphokinase [Clostridia bacterium]
MMKAFIYGGGTILTENITEHPAKDDLVIAADSGYLNARALGERVDVLIGDLDSLGSASVPDGIELIQLECEKDCTDTQAALEIAIERGYDDIVIIGGLGTRLDHSLSSMGILADMKARGIHCYITNGYNRIRYLENDSLLVPKTGYKYLSLLALDKICKGVSAEGCKYPLKNAKITRNNQFAVSNEIDGNVALVSVRKGAMLVIESRD